MFARAWMIEIGVGALLLLIAGFGIKRFFKFFSNTHFGNVALLPIQCMLWVVGIFYILDVLAPQFGICPLPAYFKLLRNALVVACFFWLIFRWKRKVELAALAGHKADSGTVHVMSKLATIGLMILGALIVLQILGVDILPLVAFGGIGAAAVGFAGKDVIANFFGGLMLYITRPCIEGEEVILPERSIEGIVEEIGWYLTTIRDKEMRPIYLPNALFSTLLVINTSRMTGRRVLETIVICHGDVNEINSLCEKIRVEIKSHPKVDKHKAMGVHIVNIASGDPSLQIDFYSHATKLQEFLKVKHEVLLGVYGILESSPVSFAETKLTVSLRSSADDKVQ